MKEKLSQRRLNQILLDNMPCVALLLRPSTREIVASNQAAVKVGAVPGTQCFATWGQRDTPCPWCLAPTLWKTGKPQHLEVEADGGRWDAHWIPIGPDLCLHYAFNISDRLRSKEILSKLGELQETSRQLEQSRNMLQLIIESIPARVFWKDRDLRYLGCNSLFARDAGFSNPQQLLGKDDFAMAWREQAELYRTADRQVMESRRPKTNIVEPQTTPAGAKIWLNTSKVPLKMPNGEVLGVLGVYEDITERKRAEEAIKEEAIWRRILVEQSTDGIVVLDQNGKVYEANQRYAEMLGYSAEEVRQLYVWDWDAHWTREELLEQLQLVDAAGDQFETRHRRKDGTFLDVEISTNGVELGGKKLVFCVCRDISERKAAEEELRRIRERMELALEGADLGTWDWNNKTGAVTFNERRATMLGYRLDEIEPHFSSWEKLVHPEDLPAVREVLKAHLEGKTPFYEAAYRLRHKFGEWVWVLDRGKVIERNANGEPLRTCGIHQDITARKQAEANLRQSEEKYRLVFEKAPLGIMHYDQTSTIINSNEKFAEIIGAPKEKFIGFNLMRQLRDDKLREAVAASLKGEVGYYEGDYLSVTAGKISPVRAIFQPIFSADGVLSGGVTIFEDITERKKAEQERLRLDKLESLGVLAGGIAHDFNNILTAIAGNISLAMLDQEVKAQDRERLTEAEKACHQAQKLSRQLLTFAKGGAPIKELISLETLIAESASLTCRGTQVRCEFAFGEDLRAIEGDPGQISQVIQNLILNAIQAMPDGGTLKIRGDNLRVGKNGHLPLEVGNYVEVTIQDKGIGIHEEYLQKIFDPYFTTKQKGSGLGLATAFSIAKKHHGHISVESKLGEGTTFRVYLPASEQKVMQPPQEKNELFSGKGKILVMDDEPMVRQVLDRMLHSLGYEAKCAKDGVEALALFREAQKSGDTFTGVILDLTVPGGMGGEETMARLLKIDPQVKAIVSSGYSDDPIMADFKKFGFAGVIAKPYKLSDLANVLNKIHTG